MKVTESQLQKEVLRLLATRNVIHWRQSLGGVLQHVGEGRVVLKSNPMTGFPDIAGITFSGQFWAMEIKTKTGRLSIEQSFWLTKLQRSNAIVAVVRSVEEAEAFIDKLTASCEN